MATAHHCTAGQPVTSGVPRDAIQLKFGQQTKRGNRRYDFSHRDQLVLRVALPMPHWFLLAICSSQLGSSLCTRMSLAQETSVSDV
eukprot:1978609-Amphidinium_carterae.2